MIVLPCYVVWDRYLTIFLIMQPLAWSYFVHGLCCTVYEEGNDYGLNSLEDVRHKSAASARQSHSRSSDLRTSAEIFAYHEDQLVHAIVTMNYDAISTGPSSEVERSSHSYDSARFSTAVFEPLVSPVVSESEWT